MGSEKQKEMKLKSEGGGREMKENAGMTGDEGEDREDEGERRQ